MAKSKENPGSDVAALSFEAALAELETTVSRMDDGSLSLEESLAAYRRGAQLVKHCQGALEAVRQQVQVLDGELLKPFAEMPAGERGPDAG